MQAFVSNGFRGQELSWLNTMRMFIKAISLAGIVTANGSVVTHQAYLFKHSNGLCDSFDWWPHPLPGEWSPSFVNLWVRALKSCFIDPFGIPSSWALLQVVKLRRGTDSSVIDKWKSFYSDSENKSFCRTKWGWDTSVHSTRGKYCLSAFPFETRPTSATKLITFSHRNTLVLPERPSSWETVQQELHPNEYIPMDDPPPCINSFFQDLVQTPRALLDKFNLPSDGGATIAQTISAGTADTLKSEYRLE